MEGTLSYVITSFLIAVLLWKLFLKIKELYHAWNMTAYMKKTFPCPKTHWLFGHLLDDPMKAGLDWMRQATNKYGRGFTLVIGPFDSFFLLNHPDHLQHLFTESEEFSMKSEPYRFLRDWIGNGLITSHGNQWFRHRKLLTNCFHFNVLKDHICIMNKTCDVFLTILEDHAMRHESLATMESISKFTMDTLLRAMCSFESDCQLKQTDIGKTMRTFTDIVNLRWTNPLYGNDFIFFFTPYFWINLKAKRTFHSIQKGILKEKKAMHKEQGNLKRIDFVDTLLLAKDEHGQGLSDEEIVDEMNTFLFAGHDTTASAITYFLYSMAKYPDHQHQVQSEIDKLMTGRDGEDVTWEDLPRLEYLTMCLKESLRCYSMTGTGRAIKKDWDVDGNILPKTMTVFVIPYLMHHNPLVWGDDHMDFKPERFTKENIAKREPFAFLPFAAGQRNCIGQNFAMNEMKVFAARVLRKFTVKIEKDSKLFYSIVARPEEELFLSFTSRND